MVEEGAGAISRGDWELASGRLRDGAVAVAGAAFERLSVRLVRAGGDRPPGGAAHRRGGAADRGGAGAGAGRDDGRRSRAAGPRAPLPGAVARPADAGAIPDGPPSRRARRVPGGATDAGAGARDRAIGRAARARATERATTRRCRRLQRRCRRSPRAIFPSRPRRSSAALASLPRSRRCSATRIGGW